MASTALARSAGCSSRRLASSSASGPARNNSGCLSHGTIVVPRPRRARPCETAIAETSQPTRWCSRGTMATSTTVPASVCRPYSSEARISPVRRVKRSKSTVPPRRCAPSTDISVIAPRLTKMRRRCNVTTSPSARGGSLPAAGRITASRTRPMVSPSLSRSGRPFSRDVNTWAAVIVWPSPPAPHPTSTHYRLLRSDRHHWHGYCPGVAMLSGACW